MLQANAACRVVSLVIYCFHPDVPILVFTRRDYKEFAGKKKKSNLFDGPSLAFSLFNFLFLNLDFLVFFSFSFVFVFVLYIFGFIR